MSLLEVKADQRRIAAAKRMLAQYEGAPLAKRTQKAQLAAGRILVGPMKRVAPKRPLSQGGGKHKKSIKARMGKRRGGFGFTNTVLVGPTDYKRHWIILGTQAHSLETKRPGKSLFAVIGLTGVSRRSKRAAGLEKVGVIPTRYLYRGMVPPSPYVGKTGERLAPEVFRVLVKGVTDVRSG